MSRPGPLVLGATGHLGRSMRRANLPGLETALWQSRTPRAGFLTWNFMNDPAPDIAISGVVMLARGDGDCPDTALAQFACDLGAAHGVPVLLASSQAVYGRTTGPLSEATPPAPVDPNGRAKLAMEQAVAGASGVTVLRIGNVAGAGPLFWSMAKGPVRLDEVAPGQGPQRAFVGAATFGRVVTALLQHDRLPPVLNVANPGLLDMADVLRAAGADWRFQPAPSTALARVELDVSELLKLVDVPKVEASAILDEARLTGWSMP